MTGEMMLRYAEYYGNDVQRINHAMKVYAFAKSIAELEGLTGDVLLTVEAAAVLHDIGIKESERKYNSAAGPYQEKEGPPVARQVLEAMGMEEGLIGRVCALVGSHHSYDRVDGIDFQILVEADFLVNIHEGGMDFQQIASIGRKYFRTKSGISYLKIMYGYSGEENAAYLER